MELLVTFLLSLALIAGVLWVLTRSRAPAYRPTRQQVLALLDGVQDKGTSSEQWDMFVSLPIHHDPPLDAIRRRCVALSEGDAERAPARSGIGGYLFDREGRAQVAACAEALRQLIASEPAQREF
ncbi:hypothetical protein [Motiliproteus sp. SC1-56]|uniref:hypothetical protein n=1 Tax=Motiliproteus sp. SC1-56 TaxID=2799565 RepID=UPI001A8EAC72|nr:hypothetical protein [Motiliproteus sp. SC1-56]